MAATNDVTQELIDIIQGAYPDLEVYHQGSFTEDQPYPPAFFTYWRWSGASISNYSNAKYSHYTQYDINFYTTDPQQMFDVIEDVTDLLINNNFQIINYSRDRPSDVASHQGQGLTVTKTIWKTVERNTT